MSKFSKKFSSFAYPFIKEKIESEKISNSELSRITNIDETVLDAILYDERTFLPVSFRTVFALFDVLDVNPNDVIDEYFKQLYGLSEDDCNVVAIYNVVEGSKGFSLSEEDFKLAVRFLERLTEKKP